MVADFAIGDSLHMIHLGIMKRLLSGWKNGGHNFKDTKLPLDQQNKISIELKKCNARRPTELHRAIRGIDCLAFWKGLEFRTFLLYLGPTILKDIVSEQVYNHFMLLFCIVTIFTCQTYIEEGFLTLAEELITAYLEEYIDIYQIDSINNNVHNLRHLAEDIKKFGSLPKFSAYRFENKLGQIKHLLRSGNRPLSQVVKRLSEINNVKQNKTKITYPYLRKESKATDCDTESSSNQNFDKVYLMDGVMLANNQKDQWFLTETDDIVKMMYATYHENQIHIYGASVRERKNFFNYPIESNWLNIYCCLDIVNSPQLYPLTQIKCKMIGIEYKKIIVLMPLLHTIDLLRK